MIAESCIQLRIFGLQASKLIIRFLPCAPLSKISARRSLHVCLAASHSATSASYVSQTATCVNAAGVIASAAKFSHLVGVSGRTGSGAIDKCSCSAIFQTDYNTCNVLVFSGVIE